MSSMPAASVTNLGYGLGNVITGILDYTGKIVAGTGFDCVHSGSGLYTITYTNRFQSQPIVLVGVLQTSGNAIDDLVPGASASGFEVAFVDAATGVQQDTPWNFLAVQVQVQ